MSFLGFCNAVGINTNNANNGPGPQLHNGDVDRFRIIQQLIHSTLQAANSPLRTICPLRLLCSVNTRPLAHKAVAMACQLAPVALMPYLQVRESPTAIPMQLRTNTAFQSSSSAVNASALGIWPQHVRVLESSAGLSATSFTLPPASTRPRHLQNSPVTRIMLENQTSTGGNKRGGNRAQENSLLLPLTHIGHANKVQVEYPTSTVARSSVTQTHLAVSAAVTPQELSSFKVPDTSNNSEPLSSNTSLGDDFITQTGGTLSTPPLPSINASVVNNPTINSQSPGTVYPQLALLDMSNAIASRGEAKQTTKQNCGHVNDSGLETSSRDRFVELPHYHTRYPGQSTDATFGFSGLADQTRFQLANTKAPENHDGTEIHVLSSYSELAHALTPVVHTPTASPSSSTSPTSSSLTHTLFPAPPASGSLSTISSSSLVPATIRQNDQTGFAQKSGPGSPFHHSQQEDNGPQSSNKPATHPPSETGRKKRKFDDLELSSSSSPATSPLQDKTDAQPSGASLAQPDETDESGPKPKRKRGRPKKPKAPSSQFQRKGFRPIARRPSASPPMTIARSTASPSAPSSLSGPSSWESMRDVGSARGSAYPTIAHNGQDFQEIVDIDDQERRFAPLLHRKSTIYHLKLSRPLTKMT
ncbi:hypothetical protein CVT26_004121 [Gymnopilus dilepis]|uniref:Uncharacterized protein n=1 Tax=Gymnopilus dilepis TaxID=231916 RepID=A0A409YV77_9AGAR|nr:hypothetical protein CVT26_004121 [Gymnopilus dilepis]